MDNYQLMTYYVAVLFQLKIRTHFIRSDEMAFYHQLSEYYGDTYE